MKRFSPWLIWVIIAFFANTATLEAQTDPTMDAKWTVITNDGGQLILELGIRTNTPGENLGPAQFVFEFDNSNYVSFDGGGSPGGTETDYKWKSGFGPPIYDGSNTGVTQTYLGSHTELINIALDFKHGTGIAISSASDYTPVIQLTFAVSDPTQSTNISWAMSELNPPVFDNVYNDDLSMPTNFDTGYFLGIHVNPLPVTLQNFSAVLRNSETVLSWITASEINNNYFTVERSGDGLNFSPLTQVKGAGNSEVKKEYVAYDESPLPGLSYYRLRQTDFNGASQMFNMVPVNNTNAIGNAITIAGVSTNIGIPVITYLMPENAPISLMVTDMTGKIIYKEQVAAQKGLNTFWFSDALYWKPGIYSIALDSKGQSASTKMLMP